MNKVHSFFYDTGNGQLFCTIIGDPTASDSCTIYLAPLFEERMWSQRIAFNFATELWEKLGQPVFIFDYYGCGESDGDTEDFSLLRFQQDFQQILALLKNKYGFSGFVLWGIRTGSALALEGLAVDSPNVSMLLWAPVLNLKDYVYSQLRSTLSSQSAVFREILAKRDDILTELLEHGKCEREGYLLNHIDGYRFGRAFWQEIQQFDYSNLIQKLNVPALFLDVISPKASNESLRLLGVQEVGHKEIIHEKVEAVPFWLDRLDYSQVSEEIYHISLQWYNRFLNHSNT